MSHLRYFDARSLRRSALVLLNGRMGRAQLACAVAVVLSAACHKGVIGDPSRAVPDGSGNPSPDPNHPNPAMPPAMPTPEACASAPVTVGPAPLRRLTNTEYANTV